MNFVKIHRNKTSPPTISGNWIWNDKKKFEFIPKKKIVDKKCFDEKEICLAPPPSIGVQFKNGLDPEDELIFRRIFIRPSSSFGSQSITIQDIKNLVFYLAPSHTLKQNNFIEFFYTEKVDKFLNSLITYFEYFLKVINFLIKRREDIYIKGKLRTIQSSRIETMISNYLMQYRILVARDYSEIILDEGRKKSLFSLESGTLNSLSGQFKCAQEYFIPFAIHIVWIAMNRKHYLIIETEMRRLFLQSNFKTKYLLDDTQKQNMITFSKLEMEIIYGENFFKNIKNSLHEPTPLVKELLNIKNENLPILWIGKRKYEGNDPRIQYLEKEILAPESQLNCLNIKHGILGHSKSFYNTMFVIVWDNVRKCKYNEDVDPFKICHKDTLEIPKWEDYIKKYNILKSQKEYCDKRFEKDIALRQIKLWETRDKIIKKEKEIGVDDDITYNLKKEFKKVIFVDRAKILQEYRQHLRKFARVDYNVCSKENIHVKSVSGKFYRKRNKTKEIGKRKN